MKSLTLQLPTVLGSCAAMMVAFISLLHGSQPGACMAQAGAAFLVFAGFGIVLRYAITESGVLDNEEKEENDITEKQGLNMIVPGTSVAELLGSRIENAADGSAPPANR